MAEGGLAAISGDYQYRALTSGSAIQRAWHRAKLRLVDTLVRPAGRGTRVLDVGCGSGVVAGHLARKGCTVVGVDGNPDAIRFARQQFGGRTATFELAPLEDLQPQHDAFDWFVCLEVLEHLEPRAANTLLARLRGAATPSAQLLVTTPNYRGTWPLIEWLADGSGKVARLDGDQHITRFTAGSLRASVRSAGWHLVREGTFSTFAPVAGAVNRRLESRAFEAELRANLPFGNLLYLVAAA